MKATHDMVFTLASVAGMVTSGAAAMTIWLLLTQPMRVATAVNTHDFAPLAQAMAGLLVEALSALVRYL